MKRHTNIKWVVDLLMSVLFLLSLAHFMTGNLWHEILGTALTVCFIVHNWLNRGWYRAIFKGRYTPLRGVLLGVNLLLAAVMIGMCVSGIMISRDVFAFLQLDGSWTARRLHSFFAYWGLIVMSVHAGLNGGLIRPHLPLGAGRKGTCVRMVLWLAAAYGLYAFFQLGIGRQLLFQAAFAHLPKGTGEAAFIGGHLAVMWLFAAGTYQTVKLLGGRKSPTAGGIHA